MRTAGESLAAGAFHHLAIQVRDLVAAEQFYCGVLGLPVLRRWDWSPEQRAEGRTGARSVWLALGTGEGAGFLALEACTGAPREAGFRDEQPGLLLVALRIAAAERQEWEDRLRQFAVSVVCRSAYTLYVRDPEGNRVGLSHWPTAS